MERGFEKQAGRNPFDLLAENSGKCVSGMRQEIARICRDFRRRSPGSESERKAAEYMAGLLRDECGCSDLKVESFEEHPDSFYGYFYFSTVCDTLCAVFFFIRPWLSILFGCMGLFLFLFHFVMYRPVIDRLFPRRTGTNVTAVRPCSGEVRQRIFLNGHTDAAWEFPLNYRFGGIVFEIPGLMATAGVFFYLFLAACALGGTGDWVRTAGLWGLAFVPFFLLLSITYNPRRIVDGANDNLSGCMMGIGLLREMEKHGIRPEHTEIGVILTGSEEAGLRGAKAWCRTHREDYKDVPTSIICYDTIYNPRWLMVNRKDLNATVRSDEGLCNAFLQAAKAAGVPCRSGRVPLFGGATDSAAFTQGGFRSAGITGMSHQLERIYHTRRDTADNLNAEALENCYRATVELIRNLDRKN